jgi:hypothetical protein
MSSPEPTRGKSGARTRGPARPPAAPAKAAVKRSAKAVAVKPAKPAGAKPAKPIASGVSAEAERLAAVLDAALAEGRLDVVSPQALQALFAALCKNYSARVEAGEDVLPLNPRGSATPTDVMVTASKLLKSANLQVFELGMWQSWTGR